MGRVSGTDSDFSDYVDARWSSLFRTSYVLCADRRMAEDLTRDALAQAYVGWSRTRESDDPDEHVRHALLRRHVSWRTRRSWAAEASTSSTAVATPIDTTVPMAPGESVLEALMSLTPAQRTVIVLGWGSDVRPQQIAEATGLAVGAVMTLANEGTRELRTTLGGVAVARSDAQPMRQDLRSAIQAALAVVRVSPQRTDDVVSAGRSRRRRRRVTVLASVVVSCLMAGSVAWAWDSAEPGPDPDPDESRAVSWDELKVPWIKGRRIVYADTIVARPPDLVALASTADSALMTVGDGRVFVIEVLPDGTQTVIGEDVIGIALGDTAGHVAAWTESVDAGTVRVVAYDTAEREVIATIEVVAGTQVYALDGRILVLNDGENGYVWSAGFGEPPVPYEPGTDEQVVTDLTASHVFVTDFGVGSQLLDGGGDVVASFAGSRFSTGSFDPSGRFLSGLRPDDLSASMNIYDMKRDQLVGLGVTGDIGWTRWTPDGRLVIRVSQHDQRLNFADTPVHYFVCEPADGDCRPLPPSASTLRNAEGVEAGFLGQLTMTDSPATR